MAYDNTVYWVWVTLCLGFNNSKARQLYDLYDNIKELYDLNEQQRKYLGIFSEKELNSFKNTELQKAEQIIEKCKILGCQIITFDSEQYPEQLLQIYAAPCVLYVKGEFPDFSTKLAVSIVGTRKASVYGIKTAFEVAYGLAVSGITIVSGAALGIDSAAHKGALAANGATLAILGCGINTNYLSQTKGMRESICTSGALISEYPPDTPALPYNFPARNRIISALSVGVIVIEAGIKSGSLITSGLALEQGKDVFAIMANVDSPQSVGSNLLIKDGAIPITGYKDVIKYYFPEVNTEVLTTLKAPKKAIHQIPIKKDIKKIISKENITANTQNISENSKAILKLLSDEPIHIDEIMKNYNKPISQVLSSMTELELYGLVERVNGRYFQIKKSK